VDTLASLRSRGEANFYPSIKVVLLSVCVLHSGAISRPFLFLSAPQGVVWMLPSGSPRNTGVPRLLPLPLTEPTTCNMEAGDDEAEAPGSSGGVDEESLTGKHPRHNTFQYHPF
jgi:hypothetical protein